MNALGHLLFSTIPVVPMLYLILTPLATRSLISTILWMLLAFLLSWGERRRLAAAGRLRPELGEEQPDDEGYGKMNTRGQRYRKGTAIWRSERRILEGDVERMIPDKRDRLRWYRERARELELRVDEGEDKNKGPSLLVVVSTSVGTTGVGMAEEPRSSDSGPRRRTKKACLTCQEKKLKWPPTLYRVLLTLNPVYIRRYPSRSRPNSLKATTLWAQYSIHPGPQATPSSRLPTTTLAAKPRFKPTPKDASISK
ncbi:hypothetical protein VE02_02716 [Pseudogymnoascus sp. 03VT05]|nr:hypothetical protein VE02_02716 [Pseudogymnoascus sp. 03VT05]